MHPVLHPVDSEPLWQRVYFVAENDEPVLLSVDVLVDLRDLATLEVCHIDHLDNYRPEEHFVDDGFHYHLTVHLLNIVWQQGGNTW